MGKVKEMWADEFERLIDERACQLMAEDRLEKYDAYEQAATEILGGDGGDGGDQWPF